MPGSEEKNTEALPERIRELPEQFESHSLMELCDWLNERGCLLLAISDKPKEASMPHQRWHKGMLPVHRTPTHAVGTSIRERLDALN